MKGRLFAGVMMSALVAGFVGCGASLKHPPSSPHTPDEFNEIPFPPPAIRADLLPVETRADAYWIDGEWNWNGLRWAWRAGGYIVPPAGATLAPWEIRREGTLLRQAPSIFHLPNGTAVLASDLRENRPNRPKDIECVPAGSAAPPASVALISPGPPGSPPAAPAPAGVAQSAFSSGNAQVSACILVEP